MSKKPAKPTESRAAIAKRSAEIAAETALLRRLNRQHSAMTQLAQRLRRAVRRADLERITTARALVEGTEYAVFGVAAVESHLRRIEALNEEATALHAEIKKLHRALDAERERADLLGSQPSAADREQPAELAASER